MPEILEATVTLNDTSEKAAEVYRQRLKEMSPSERVALAVGLWHAGDSVQRAAAHLQHPDATESEITFQLAVSRFGSELARKAYGKP